MCRLSHADRSGPRRGIGHTCVAGPVKDAPDALSSVFGMASIFVTGSSDGIGQETARQLVKGGHRVVLHARDEARAEDAAIGVPEASGVAVGDLSDVGGMRQAAESASALGPYDAVIHNAGVGSAAAPHRTADGCERIFAVNVLGPYLLTALMPLPPRLVYLSSGLESVGRAHLDDLQWDHRAWNGMQAYSDSKLYDVLLAFAVARRYPQLRSNAVDPGWIKTKLGGQGATDELPVGAQTQVWLATSDEPDADVTGRYFKWRRDLQANPAAYDTSLQEALLAACAKLTGSTLPD
jgi:NAD(P)-dependent dehydrogenase (short-subunit alcohol dehydrogenase family)